MDNLEKIVGEVKQEKQNSVINSSTYERKGTYQKIKDTATDYLVDVSSGWTFFTPIYAMMEHYVVGMDSGKVFDSRSAGLVAHAIAMRPTGMLRNKLAKKWDVTKESPWYKKVAVNVCAGTPIQAVMYTGILAYSGASMDEIAYHIADRFSNGSSFV